MSSMANGNALEKYRGVPEARDASRVATGRLRALGGKGENAGTRCARERGGVGFAELRYWLIAT